jgi:hypothetical protein
LSRRKRWIAPLAAALLLTGCADRSSGGGDAEASTPVVGVERSTAPSEPEAATSEAEKRCGTDYTGEHFPGTIEEFVCNGNGASVYLDNRGTAAEGHIPNGTHVNVRCYEENLSGMSSVTKFYVLGPPKDFMNLRVPSDVFWNGGMGINWNRKVPECLS